MSDAGGLGGSGAPAATGGPGGTQRIAFVDVLRTIAVLRVVVNHSLLWPWLTWFEAMPVMFFVSGTLVARSLATRPWRSVLTSRFKRLALPVGVYLVFAVLMSGKALGWLGGTTIQLWYVWNFLAFTAISPLLIKLVRRFPLWTIAVIVAAIVAMSTLGPKGSAPGAAYLLFWFLGMWWAERGCPIPPRPVLAGIVVTGYVAAITSVHFLVGLSLEQSPSVVGISMAGLGAAWLSLGLIFRNQLDALIKTPHVGAFIKYLNRRLLTIYLWHVPATLVARDLADRWDLTGAAWFAVVMLITIVLTGAATVLLGGLEDRAAKSSAKHRTDRATA